MRSDVVQLKYPMGFVSDASRPVDRTVLQSTLMSAGLHPQGSGVFRTRGVWPGMRWIARTHTVCEHGHATVIM